MKTGAAALLTLAVFEALFGLISTAAFADKPEEFLTLSARRTANREAVSIQPYSEKDRDLVIGQTSLFLREMYAHLALKEQRYPHYDPFDQIQSVIDRKMDLSDMDFHVEMSKAFLGLQDLHTNYFFPRPYACYTNALPFAVDEAYDPKTKARVAVIAAVTNTPGMVKLSQGIEKLEVGDIVELYDGKKPLDELASLDLAQLGAGANRDAYKRRAIERLSMRPQELDPLPTTAPGNDPDTVKITVRPRGNGAPFTLSFPWISFYTDPTCLGLPADPSFVAPKGFPWIDPPSSSDFGKEYSRLFSRAKARRAARSNATGGPAPVPAMNLSGLTVTAEPSISYKVLTDAKNKKTFGYLAIGAFEPYVKSIPQSLAIVRGILGRKFAQTDGLILDVRDNHGGIISYGEEMIQYFTPKDVVPETFRTRASEANLKFLKAAELGPYPTSLGVDYPKVEEAISQSLAGTQSFAETAEAGVITPVADANAVGQLYFKPVVVLTNSNCFSTCDIFTAGMQDHGVAEIWAVDGRTGGGGANVMDQGYFLEVLPKGQTLFTALSNGQDFRVAWRQAERVLINSGTILEGVGAAGDHGDKSPDGTELVLTPTPDDIALEDQLTIRRLTRELAKLEKHSTGSCVVAGGDEQNFVVGHPATLSASISGTAQVEFLEGGRSLGHQGVPTESATPVSTTLVLPLSARVADTDSGTIEMIGTDARGNRSWRKMVSYRVVSPPTAITGPFTIDFSGGQLAPLELFNSAQTDPKAGWNVVQGELRTGLSGNYADNVTTDVSLFADLSALAGRKIALSIDAEAYTEKNFDFFEVSAVTNGEKKTLLTLTGNNPEQTYSLDLSDYAGQTVELRLVFTSDGGTNDKGVFIKGLKLEPL